MPRRADGARRPREWPGPPRRVPPQRHEYLESMLARARPGSHRSTSTTATWPTSCATCSTDAGASAIVVHVVFAPTLAEVLPTLPAAAGDRAGARRVRPRPPAGRGLVRGRARRRVARPAAAPAQPRRSVHPLHRRHDRDAQGRAVAQRRCDRGVLRRLADGAHGRRARRRRCRRCAGAARAAVHARRRALGGAARVDRRAARCTCCRIRRTSTRRTSGPRRAGADRASS